MKLHDKRIHSIFETIIIITPAHTLPKITGVKEGRKTHDDGYKPASGITDYKLPSPLSTFFRTFPPVIS